MKEFIRGILAAGVMYMVYVFAVFCVVVALIGGIADIIYHDRKVKAQDRWTAEAEAAGEEFFPVDYTPNLVTGLVSLALFGVSVVMLVRLFMRRFDRLTHAFVIAATALAGFIYFIPRIPLGTGTDHMLEAYAYLALLGLFESVLYGTYILKDSEEPPTGVSAEGWH